MTEAEIKTIITKQRDFFAKGETLPVAKRIAALKKLYGVVKSHEKEITDALTADLGKSVLEGFMCEAGLVMSEISYMIKHTRKFAKDSSRVTCLTNFAAKSFVKSSPYGNVLIMSPWNYPFLLTIDPLVDAIAAGNTCVVKPSAYSPATSAIIAKLISECFEPDYVAVVTGGRAENTCLLEQKFDYIFFTGSQGVGKEVLRKAAEYLTPVTLELGGKSPCIIDSSAKVAAGGKSNAETLKIEPTVLDNVSWDDAVMGEEIFGPVLPVLTYKTEEELYQIINAHQKPLALYLFTQNKGLQKRVMTRCSFGGGCINDVVVHLATNNMGFGGVGESGMGAYHGKVGFDTFSHKKSIVDKKTWIDVNMRYQPYTKSKETFLRLFLK